MKAVYLRFGTFDRPAQPVESIEKVAYSVRVPAPTLGRYLRLYSETGELHFPNVHSGW